MGFDYKYDSLLRFKKIYIKSVFIKTFALCFSIFNNSFIYFKLNTSNIVCFFYLTFHQNESTAFFDMFDTARYFKTIVGDAQLRDFARASHDLVCYALPTTTIKILPGFVLTSMA